MDRRSAAVVVALLSLLASGLVAGAAPASAAVVTSRPAITGLTAASALAVAPDGRVFVGEQTSGTIRVFNPATNTGSVFYRVPRNHHLMGLGVHWAYPGTPYVYGFGTRYDATNRQRLQLYRITGGGATGTGLAVLNDFGGLPADHYGGRIVFGPDRLLYLSVGDGGVAADAQNLASPRGKILRLTAGGTVPANNPFDSRVWAYGTRNVFGMAFDPGSTRLWATDNGPECNDELNHIVRGGNFGWGATGSCTPPGVTSTNRDGPSPILPRRNYASPPTAPTGLTFCRSCGLGSTVEGNLVYGTFVTNQLRRVPLNAARTGVGGSESVLLQHGAGIVGVERAPNGALWFIDRTSLRRVVLQ